MVTGGTPSTAERKYWGSEYPWVTPTDIQAVRDICCTDRMLSKGGLDKIRPLPEGSVLVTCIASIGKVAVLTAEGGCNQQINAVIPCQGHNKNFLYYYFLSKKQYLLENAGTTATPILSKSKFSKLFICCPPTSEQDSISEALSSIDTLINYLESLIAKKRDIQQATMQQLLSGQRRLPEFSGAWEVKQLGELVSRLANGCIYTQDEKSGVPITRIETISDGTINFARVGYAKITPEMHPYKLQQGDILYSHINSIDHIGKVARYSCGRPLYHGMNLILLRPVSSVDGSFLFFLLSSEPIRRIARTLAKQAVSQASINTAELRALELKVPSHREQTAIARILSDMEIELATLEARRDKAQLLKQGMMQELLTGRIRLTNQGV